MTVQDELDQETARLAVLVAGEAVRGARAAQGRRRTRLVLGGTAVALATGMGAAAATGTWTARTGDVGPERTTETDTSEYLDTAAPDFPQLLRDAYPELPLPAGVDLEQLVQQQVRTLRAEDGTYVQEGGLAVTAVSFALCHWQDAWLGADAVGDEAARTAALQHLRELPEHPDLAPAGVGNVERARALTAAAEAGERAPLLLEIAVNCSGWVS